jgi:hypothetical protein
MSSPTFSVPLVAAPGRDVLRTLGPQTAHAQMNCASAPSPGPAGAGARLDMLAGRRAKGRTALPPAYPSGVSTQSPYRSAHALGARGAFASTRMLLGVYRASAGALVRHASRPPTVPASATMDRIIRGIRPPPPGNPRAACRPASSAPCSHTLAGSCRHRERAEGPVYGHACRHQKSVSAFLETPRQARRWWPSWVIPCLPTDLPLGPARATSRGASQPRATHTAHLPDGT